MFTATVCKIPLSTTLTSFFAILGAVLVHPDERKNIDGGFLAIQLIGTVAAYLLATLLSFMTTYIVATQTMNTTRDRYGMRLIKLSFIFAVACAIIAEIFGQITINTIENRTWSFEGA